MAPFINSKVEWDNNDCGGRYVNVKGFKYDIINMSTVTKVEDMPECFLADTGVEAEAIYEKFEGMLNNIAYAYAVSTGINKADLFGEALIGLARAYRDWNPDRSDNFKLYAEYRIKDALREFIRRNIVSLSIPSYIQKAYANVVEIKTICDYNEVDYVLVLKKQEIPDELSTGSALRCAQLVSNLINASNRAKVSYEKFIERVEMIPEDVDSSENIPNDLYKREEEKMEAVLLVEKLKEYMTTEEREICDGIMLDKSFEQIGNEMGKSKAWVSDKVRNLRDKILNSIVA